MSPWGRNTGPFQSNGLSLGRDHISTDTNTWICWGGEDPGMAVKKLQNKQEFPRGNPARQMTVLHHVFLLP